MYNWLFGVRRLKTALKFLLSVLSLRPIVTCSVRKAWWEGPPPPWCLVGGTVSVMALVSRRAARTGVALCILMTPFVTRYVQGLLLQLCRTWVSLLWSLAPIRLVVALFRRSTCTLSGVLVWQEKFWVVLLNRRSEMLRLSSVLPTPLTFSRLSVRFVQWKPTRIMAVGSLVRCVCVARIVLGLRLSETSSLFPVVLSCKVTRWERFVLLVALLRQAFVGLTVSFARYLPSKMGTRLNEVGLKGRRLLKVTGMVLPSGPTPPY